MFYDFSHEDNLKNKKICEDTNLKILLKQFYQSGKGKSKLVNRNSKMELCFQFHDLLCQFFPFQLNMTQLHFLFIVIAVDLFHFCYIVI